MHRIRYGKLNRVMLFILCIMILLGRSVCSAEENRVIRVLMTGLNITDRLTVSLDGSYTLGDMSFQRGSEITVSSASGNLMVYYEGMAVNAGKSLRLVRHGVEEDMENGLRFDGRYPLFCGDLVLYADERSMIAVMSVPVEEYLLGVVPYEMSDSFPLEALKAQAVAARTYAISRTGGTGYYDVTDNTGDQVYKGYQKEYVNTVRAVGATEGICGFYRGEPALCYYTASNGGQVETPYHVWGGEIESYITQHADQYDVENPESPVSRKVLKKIPEDGIIGNEVFTGIVKAELSKQLKEKGSSRDETDLVIDAVGDITLQAPRYDDGSMIMTEMSLTCRVKGIQDSLTVILPVFPTVETALDLSLNNEENELITVTENRNEYVIEARRYGHGTGLSQRGAQWMASQYGWTYEQILRFYYPGLVFRKTDTLVTAAPAVQADYLTTPGPAATPTPRPTLIPVTQDLQEGEWKAVVTGIGVNSSLNLRSAPGMQGEVIRMLYFGQELIVEETLPGGWLKVRTDSVRGFVMEKFVERVYE